VVRRRVAAGTFAISASSAAAHAGRSNRAAGFSAAAQVASVSAAAGGEGLTDVVTVVAGGVD